MMLDYLGEKEAANNIIQAIEKTLSLKESRTQDLQGSSDTKNCTDSVLNNL
jgi:tartrate dehydrogenase/decarboxylase/D-malate dehydrogenase